MEHKINIHAHSVFSDGSNSPYVMALEAKRLGFSALVLTDHLYGNGKDQSYCSISDWTYPIRAQCCREASSILPIIEGIEIPVGGEEVLLFGKTAIAFALRKGCLSRDDLKSLRANEDCAIVLCHPHLSYEKLIDYVDAYELYNSGGRMFKFREINPMLLEKQCWSNSDAHHTDNIKRAWNTTKTKIETEEQLIAYIHSGEQPNMFAIGEQVYL